MQVILREALSLKGENVMKKFIALAAASVMMLSLAACNKTAETSAAQSSAAETSASQTSAAEDVNKKGEGVMTYAQYDAAKVDDAVVIEAYVQAKQSWWDNKATVYLADPDGAYFAYNMVCSEADYAKLVDGQKIKITGYKTEWSGETEVAEGATFEIEDGNWISSPVDLTAKFGTDELIKFQNQKFSVADAEVTAASTYKWDGSGEQGDDLYFKVKIGDSEYTFTVESYLCGKDTEVYKAVEGLKVGQKVDMEGFLYWYEGVNPHITKVTVK